MARLSRSRRRASVWVRPYEGVCSPCWRSQCIGAGQMLLAHVVATIQRMLWLLSAGSNTHPDR